DQPPSSSVPSIFIDLPSSIQIPSLLFMSSARIVARTGTWFRRRSRWFFLIIAAFFISYLLIVQRQSFSNLTNPSPSGGWLQGSQKEIVQQSKADHPKDLFKLESRAELLAAPRSSGQICHQKERQETKHDYDLHDLYESVAARAGGPKTDKPEPKIRPAARGKLRVFVLPFTHVDPGWLMTFDEYSVDTKTILDNMHLFMMKNPKMRFMWAEFVFFERWWKEQTEEVKKDIRELVSSGRLELASGSWVMTDEANAYFPVSVDNIVEGHQFIQREFGKLPTVVWSNDPFGYSNSVPYLFTQAGINRTVINRIHHGIKGHLQSKRAIPFQWKQYFDDSSMLTQVLPYTHYDVLNSCGPNAGSCCQFDFRRITKWSCPGPRPVPITEQNVKEKSQLLIDSLRQMASMYESPVMLMMHGDDFRFNNEEEWPQQHDNFLPLFDTINKGDQVEISFGTFSDYFNELEKWYAKESIEPPTITGDFFPYMCALGDYWTGYYTTRPFYKKQSRQTHHLIRTADLLSAEASLTDTYERLTKARRILSLFQHHDAITGTSKIHVMKDYSQQLFNAGNIAKSVIEESIRKMEKGDEKIKMIEYSMKVEEPIEKALLNVQKDIPIHISIYNSLPYIRHSVISLLVTTEKCSVVDSDGKEVEAQIEPTLIHDIWRKEGVVLSFRVSLPPLSSRVYILHQSDSPSKTTIVKLSAPTASMDPLKGEIPSIFSISPLSSPTVTLTNGHLTTTHDVGTGMMKSAKSSIVGDVPLELEVRQLTGSSGGAYILRSHGVAKNVSMTSVLFVSGPIQSSAYSLGSIVQHCTTVRDLPGALSDQVHVSIRVDLRKEHNTEMVWSVASEGDDSSSFYTDSVGLQMLRRKSYSTLQTPANYYPMPTAAILEDNKKRITVVSDVEHGVMETGKMGLEVMIDRMLNQDDGKGLGQGEDSYPTDLLPVQMHFTLVLEKTSGASNTTHHTYHSVTGTLALQEILYPTVPLLTTKASSSHLPQKSFPCDLQLLTTRLISPKQMMVTLFRNGVDCTIDSAVSCSDSKITDSIRSLVNRLGAQSSIKRTILNGITVLQEYSNIDSLDESIVPDPQKFTTLVFDV
ncbi:hypothetical protein PENTCL1PPCAC_26532, partial [Pristionchus entomophagus]